DAPAGGGGGGEGGAFTPRSKHPSPQPLSPTGRGAFQKGSPGMAINAPLGRKLRMGLVGGAGGFIGRVHALAAQLDGRAELVAGALSSDPERGRAAASDFGLAPEPAYGRFRQAAGGGAPGPQLRHR